MMPILTHLLTKIYLTALMAYPLIFLVGICWYSLKTTDRTRVNLLLKVNNIVLPLCVLPTILMFGLEELQAHLQSIHDDTYMNMKVIDGFVMKHQTKSTFLEYFIVFCTGVLSTPTFIFQFFWLRAYRESIVLTSLCAYFCTANATLTFFKDQEVSAWSYINLQNDLDLIGSLIEHAYLAEICYALIFYVVYKLVK